MRDKNGSLQYAFIGKHSCVSLVRGRGLSREHGRVIAVQRLCHSESRRVSVLSFSLTPLSRSLRRRNSSQLRDSHIGRRTPVNTGYPPLTTQTVGEHDYQKGTALTSSASFISLTSDDLCDIHPIETSTTWPSSVVSNISFIE